MEYKKIKSTTAAYQNYISEMEMFGWKLEQINPDSNDSDIVFLNFSRDPNMKNYEKIRQLEIEWFSFSLPKFWPIALFCILGFLLITALLVICMALKYNFNNQPWLYALLIPGIIFINIALFYFIYRTFRIKKILTQGEKMRDEIRQKVKKINGTEN